METGYILAHDLGTSGSKATLYDADGVLRCAAVERYPTHYPQDRFVEQDPQDWWRAVCRSTRALLERAGVGPEQVLCVSFSGMMMGCLPVDEAGEALRPMLLWADTRSDAQEREMIARIGMERGYRITGHRLSASYSAAKLLWVRDHEPEVYRHTYKMLHAKDYIVHKLTGRFVTDYSDASGTNLLDIGRKQWSQEILEALDVPQGLLPELHASSDVVGHVTREAAQATGLLEGTPVVIGGGDGSCACVGAGVVRPGSAYNVLGSSSWISLVSEQPLFDPQMRTFNWVHLDEKLYTPCGTMQAAGVSYSWFRDALGGEEARLAQETGVSAYDLLGAQAEQSPPGANGVLFLPYLLGERSPRWDHDARGAFIGMSASTTKGDLVRAVLEGVGCNLRAILDILRTQRPIGELTMIGGGAQGGVWLRILADIFGVPLALPRYREEATSLGAAVAGGVGIGLYADYSAAPRMNPVQERIQPDPANAAAYAGLQALFEEAYAALRPVYAHLARERRG